MFVWRGVCLPAGCCHGDSVLIKRHKTSRCSQPHIEEGPTIKPAVSLCARVCARVFVFVRVVVKAQPDTDKLCAGCIEI